MLRHLVGAEQFRPQRWFLMGMACGYAAPMNTVFQLEEGVAENAAAGFQFADTLLFAARY